MALVCSIALSHGALGGTSSATIFVSATVVSSCRVSTDALAFGDYDPGDTNAHSPLDAIATVTLSCSVPSQPTIRVSPGQNPRRAAGATRAMSGDAGYLAYEIFRDRNHADAWTGDRSVTLSLSPASLTKPLGYQVYGRVPAGQHVPPGTYADVVKVSIDF
ncbi:MAG: spore coat U domain-containing protein [Candidatus Binataceae bacterium]